MAACHSSHSRDPIWADQQQPMKWVRSRLHTEATKLAILSIRLSFGSARRRFLDPLRGGPAPSLPFLRPPRRGPAPSAPSLLSRPSLIPAGTGGGARLGGRAFRLEHLLSVRCCLHRFLPSWGRRQLLRHLRSHLTETRSCWHARRGLWFAALADASSCQQVLRSERRQCVHELGNGISRR